MKIDESLLKQLNENLSSIKQLLEQNNEVQKPLTAEQQNIVKKLMEKHLNKVTPAEAFNNIIDRKTDDLLEDIDLKTVTQIMTNLAWQYGDSNGFLTPVTAEKIRKKVKGLVRDTIKNAIIEYNNGRTPYFAIESGGFCVTVSKDENEDLLDITLQFISESSDTDTSFSELIELSRQ